MVKKILFALFNLLLMLNLGCSTAEVPNSNAGKSAAASPNPTALPEGLSGSQVPLSADSTPGIPDPKAMNANDNSKGAASTPGIPDTTKIGRTPMPQNTPRIPGIPDEETLRKQMNTPISREMMDRKPPESEVNSAARPNAKKQNVRKAKPIQ